MELISAIVTSYNHAEYLDKRMQSLLDQTYKNLEIIIIDDHSTDNSVEVLKKYEKYENVKLIALEKNGGYAVACNLGVQKARGEYIIFEECDDYSAPDQLEKLVSKFNIDGSIGVVYSKSNLTDSKGIITGNDFDFRDKDFKARYCRDSVIKSADMQKYLLYACVIPNMSAALFKKSIFIQSGGLLPKYKYCADWDFWLRMSKLCDFYYVFEPLNYFRYHPLTVRSQSKIELQLAEFYDLLYSAYENTDLKFSEKTRFKLNLGYIWANLITKDIYVWIRSFFPIWKNSLKYDSLSILFLFVGLIKKIFQLIKKKMNIS
jgi:glycosyltransferase involved in cell wall biosynthesis